MAAGDAEVTLFKSLGFESRTCSTSCGSNVYHYHRGVIGSSGKILVLIHGYPQSSFMWRHVIQRLPTETPLFVPDIPGYGRSSQSTKGDDKRTIGKSILEALRKLLASNNERSIVLAGHDRGARICHRLAVDSPSKPENFRIRGAMLLDIVPTIVQFRSFADPKASSTTFHWPLLANVDIATSMISSLGGAVWCRQMMDRWAGTNQRGLESLAAGGAMDVYCNYFEQQSVIRATCEDYRAGAEEDVELQIEDQKRGNKIGIDTLVVYSEGYLGRRYDIKQVWSEWVSDAAKLNVMGLGGGVGHFIAEEEPDKVGDTLKNWYEGLGV